MFKTLGYVSAFILLLVTSVSAEIITVPANGNLQAALNTAQPGDEIVLVAGATYTGTLVLPQKNSGAVIKIRSSAVLPDRRIGPADIALLPTIASGTADGAVYATDVANYTFEGIHFAPNALGHGNVIELLRAQNITFDRILLVGGADGQRRGIAGNGKNITLTRSHLANIWRSGGESQAFCAWNGAGPYTITDNYLEAASQSVMFGGANSSSAADVPADILVEGNTMTKRPEWKSYQDRVVKNIFELKSAKRVTVRNNTFTGNWESAQPGYAIVLTVRNDEGQSPWSVVEDVVFEGNNITDTDRGFNILGYDSYQPSGQLTRLTIRNNKIDARWRVLQIGAEVGELTITNNQVPGNVETLFYEGDVNVQGKLRPALYAVGKLTIYGNTAPFRFAFDGSITGRDNVQTMIGQLVTQPTTEPPPPPVDPVFDPLKEIQADLAATKTILFDTQKELAALKQLVQSMGSYMAATPTAKNLNQLISYLRLLPR